MVLPDTPGGSPVTRKWQVNVPLTRNNQRHYGFLACADSVTHPYTGPFRPIVASSGAASRISVSAESAYGR